MRRQRLYWLAEIAEHHADRWRSPGDLYDRVAREAAVSKDAVSEDDFKEVLAHLLGLKRVEYKPGREDLVRRVAPPARGSEAEG